MLWVVELFLTPKEILGCVLLRYGCITPEVRIMSVVVVTRSWLLSILLHDLLSNLLLVIYIEISLKLLVLEPLVEVHIHIFLSLVAS
jgi:hypothetical protein